MSKPYVERIAELEHRIRMTASATGQDADAAIGAWMVIAVASPRSAEEVGEEVLFCLARGDKLTPGKDDQ